MHLISSFKELFHCLLLLLHNYLITGNQEIKLIVSYVYLTSTCHKVMEKLGTMPTYNHCTVVCNIVDLCPTDVPSLRLMK